MDNQQKQLSQEIVSDQPMEGLQVKANISNRSKINNLSNSKIAKKTQEKAIIQLPFDLNEKQVIEERQIDHRAVADERLANLDHVIQVDHDNLLLKNNKN